MNTELMEYEAFLTFPPLNAAQCQQIERAAETILGELAIDLTPTALEYQYAGRDTQRKNARFFVQIAPILGDAEGEIVCSYTDNTRENSADRVFEFYTIHGGRLYCQPGSITRGQETEVYLDAPLPVTRPQLVAA